MTGVYIGYICSIYPYVTFYRGSRGVEAEGEHMKKVLFNLTDEQHRRLEDLARRMGVSKSEALRRAIEIYQIVKDAQAEGEEIRKRSKDGEETIVQIVG